MAPAVTVPFIISICLCLLSQRICAFICECHVLPAETGINPKTRRYTPEPFCYAIRRPDHYPDGTLSIESQRDSDKPIMTITRKLEATESGADVGTMHFPINAATNVEFKGDRYLHAWVAHEFDRDGGHGTTVSSHLVALLAECRVDHRKATHHLLLSFCSCRLVL